MPAFGELTATIVSITVTLIIAIAMTVTATCTMLKQEVCALVRSWELLAALQKLTH